MGKRKIVSTPSIPQSSAPTKRGKAPSKKAKLDAFDAVPIEPETRIVKAVQALPEHREAMEYLQSHALTYLLDPDPTDQIMVYPKAVRAFYRTLNEAEGQELAEHSDNPRIYTATIKKTTFAFTSVDLCACLEYPSEYLTDSGFEQPQVTSLADMVQALSTEEYKGQCFVRRSALPRSMRLLDTVIRKNLLPFGHEQERYGSHLEVLSYMHSGMWFDVGELFIETMLRVTSVLRKSATTPMKLYFPRLITGLLWHKGVPMTEPPSPEPLLHQFTMANWNLSRTHLDKAAASRSTVGTPSHPPPPARTLIERLQAIEDRQTQAAEDLATLRAYVASGFEDIRITQELIGTRLASLFELLGQPPPAG